MKSYTDLEQSKRLAKFLPLKSADMWWNYYSVTTDFGTPQIIHLDTPWVGSFNWYNELDNIPCWSLAALFDIIPGCEACRMVDSSNKWEICSWNDSNFEVQARIEFCDDLVDACVDMILELHERKLL